MPLEKDSNDGDVGYTCVDARQSGISVSGGINFQDATITSAKILAVQLAIAAKASLVTTVSSSQGAAAKVLTMAGVLFTGGGGNSDAGGGFTGYDASFACVNDATTQLTLSGANKILTIA